MQAMTTATPTSPATPSPMERVRRIATWVRLLAVAGGALLVGATLWFWSSPEWVTRTASVELGLAAIALTPAAHAGAVAVAMLPVLVGLFALWQVWLLFGSYARGEIFTAGTTARLRRLAWALVGVAGAQIVARTALGLVLTMNNPPGQKALVIGLSSHDYVLLLFGVLLLAIAWVMVEATRLARENQEFV